MPLVPDDTPGSWEVQSADWPSTPYTMGKWLLCTKAAIVPYGCYVLSGVEYTYPHQRQPDGTWYDHSKAVIRCESWRMVARLEEVYNEMFVTCRHLLIAEEFAAEFGKER